MVIKRNEKGQFVKGSQHQLNHGACKGGQLTPLYRVWQNFKSRCKNPNVPNYDQYGGRGISVCEQWEEFENFQKWALGNGYKEGLQIDRIDNDSDYCPENCHFVTRVEQMNNKTDNHYLTFNGKTQTLAQWAREKDIKYHTLKVRINSLNWSTERALTEEVHNGSTTES